MVFGSAAKSARKRSNGLQELHGVHGICPLRTGQLSSTAWSDRLISSMDPTLGFSSGDMRAFGPRPDSSESRADRSCPSTEAS